MYNKYYQLSGSPFKCEILLAEGFGDAFGEFVRAAEYENKGKSEGNKVFYRFWKPAKPDYPFMLELFSRKPDMLVLGEDSHLTPIPIGEDVSSLSAILLDGNYYDFIHRHKRKIEGISIVDKQCLIPLKARAWLGLTQRKADGGDVDSKDIRKHRNDVLRLYQVLLPELRIELPEAIRNDLSIFPQAIELELSKQLLKRLGIKGIDAADVLQTIKTVYGMTERIEWQ